MLLVSVLCSKKILSKYRSKFSFTKIEKFVLLINYRKRLMGPHEEGPTILPWPEKEPLKN